ncbi:helix-turn-helix transcriptional regulator [Pontibacter virosus]|uniref:Putative DNA-binding transcriptional regulator YafY n=1 Tax=Pontibacter virosus TaxID=1765052 RepID=A0A2U1AWS8_9BACT|nr:WYL domain-containing protein [Pontibacter virosus]PVY40870.1 putative DNA-binding transcriptional regulator YafY [Pontibacter virosus]
MPQNKNALVRMQVIDACLRSRTKKYWSKRELIDRIGEAKDIRVSRRTLDHDIYQMRYCSQLNYNAPIEYLKKEDGYFYTDPNFSIEKLPLNEVEINALAMAAATLGQYKHVDVLSQFSSTIDKVITLVKNLKQEGTRDGFSFIDFEKAPYSKGNEHLDFLIEAIRNRKAVKLSYLKFDDSMPNSRTVSPYLLKEYRNRWYLLCVQHENGQLRKFGLDRIVSLEPAHNVSYENYTSLNPELYFRNVIGISFEGEKVEEVILSFSPHDGNYVKTQHLHNSQETLVDDNNELRIKLNVVINYELISTILSFGKGVRVISPVVLRQQIANILAECCQFYYPDSEEVKAIDF